MASGTYGTVRPADIQPSDAEIFVHYTTSRSSAGEAALTKYKGEDLLVKIANPNNTTGFEIFGGLYTLKLPAANFSKKGIYTIVIKPIEIRAKIADCGVLSTLPDVKGIIFDVNTIDVKFREKFINNGLIGYRVEYLDTNATSDTKISNFFRIITSNNKVEGTNTQMTTSNGQLAIRYLFNDASANVFCTLSPSSAPTSRPNTGNNGFPYLGTMGQNVIITNTFFNPIMIEIEMVDHDIETLAYGLFANQSKSLEDGVYTIYNFSDQIYKQYNLYEIKDKFTGKPLFEVRQLRTSIDVSKEFNNIKNV